MSCNHHTVGYNLEPWFAGTQLVQLLLQLIEAFPSINLVITAAINTFIERTR